MERDAAYSDAVMKPYLEKLRTDPLIRTLLVPGGSINGATFFMLLVMAWFFAAWTHLFFSAPLPAALMLFYPAFNLTKARLKHLGLMHPTLAAVACSLVLTGSSELILGIPSHLTYWLPSQWLYGSNESTFFSHIIAFIPVVLYAALAVFALASITVIIVLSVLKGEGEESYAFRLIEKEIAIVRFRGNASRETLALFTLVCQAAAILTLLLYSASLVLRVGLDRLSDLPLAFAFDVVGQAVITIITALLALFQLSCWARRLHSLGWSGVWLLLLIPISGIATLTHPVLLMLVPLFTAATTGARSVVFISQFVVPVLATIGNLFRAVMVSCMVVIFFFPERKKTDVTNEYS
jgi:hypothetical protein